MDPTVLSRLCGQPGAAATVRVGVQPGQLPAASRVAPSSASLDVDDVAGETDQDRGEGRAPCPAGGLPDGGGGGPAGAVPGHAGRDSAAEIAHTSAGLTPAGRKSREGEVLEETLCLRLVANRC